VNKIAINAIEKLISLYDMQFGGDVGKFFLYDTHMKRIAESDLLEFTPQVVSEFSDAAWRRGFFFGQAGVHFVFAKMEEVRSWRLLPENVVAAME